MGTDPVSVERVSALAAVPEGFFAGVGGGEETWIGALFEADFFFFKKNSFGGFAVFCLLSVIFRPFFSFFFPGGRLFLSVFRSFEERDSRERAPFMAERGMEMGCGGKKKKKSGGGSGRVSCCYW